MAKTFVIDHFMLATPDLAETTAEIERRTRARLGEAGRHTGQGTRKLLLPLGVDCRLELIGPDPSGDSTGNLGKHLGMLPGPAVLMFGMRACDIQGASARATALGLWGDVSNKGRRGTGPIVMSRLLPAGGVARWRLPLKGDDVHQPGMPSFIHWEGTLSVNSANGRTLAKFWVGPAVLRARRTVRRAVGCPRGCRLAKTAIPRAPPQRTQRCRDLLNAGGSHLGDCRGQAGNRRLPAEHTSQMRLL